MAKVYAGVDLGGTSMIAVVATKSGKVLGSSDCATPRGASAAETIATVGDQIESAAREAGVKPSKLCAIGIGAPGAIDRKRGVVVRAPNLGWSDVPLAELLSQRFGAEVALGNDVQVAIIGEHRFGAARGTSRAAGIWVGTGVGGGLINDGRLDRGARGAAGEIGHTVVAEEGTGPVCGCGRTGCVEAFASRTAMERDVRAAAAAGKKTVVFELMEKKKKERMTSSVIAKALAANDAVMRDVMSRAQHRLGLLAGNIVNLYDPEMIVVGGGIAQRLGEEFVGPIREVARSRFLRPDPEGKVKIVAATLGDLSGALGASAMARSEA